jgi:hypothetical protein
MVTHHPARYPAEQVHPGVSMRCFLLLAAVALAACGGPDHQNPFDPSTPAAQQARATLTGSVQLESVNGAPPSLADVRVTVTGAKATLVAFTDPSGVWTASEVPVGGYTIAAARSGYRSGVLTGVQVTLDDGGTVLSLPPLALVAGRGEVSGTVKLLLPDGTEELAGGAAVSLRGLPGTVQSARDGAYLMTGVPAGDYVVDATKYGYQAGAMGGVSVSDMGIASVAILPLATDPGLLEGTVTRNDGGDIRLALVRARGFTLGGTPWESSAHPYSDGTFLISNLPAGNYQVTFELTDFGTETMSAAIAPAEPTNVPTIALVRDTGSIVGVARLASASDHSGLVVSLTPVPTAANPTPKPLASAVTDATGSWRIDLLPVGDYTAEYSKAPGYVKQSGAVTIVKGTTSAATVTLALDVSASLSGVATVARPAGANAGIGVALSGSDLNGNAVSRTTSTVDAAGHWSIAGLAQGTYAVTFSLPLSPYSPQSVNGIFVAAGQAVTAPAVTLAVADGGIAGAVTLDVTTVPGFGAIADRSGTVVTISDGASALESTVTDALGGYRFAIVPALPVSGATYAITARRANFGTATIQVAPQAGATLPGNDLTLQLQAGTLQGSVVLWDNVGNAGANPISNGAVVSIAGTAFNGVTWTAAPFTTPDSGAWSFPALPPGTYDILVSSTGRSCAAYTSQVVTPGASTPAGAVQCRDAIAPGAPGLGQPLATGSGIAGWVSGTTVTIPLTQAAIDGTTPNPNLRAYQIAVGAAPSWDAALAVSVAPTPPTQLTVSGLVANATNVVWVRAFDWADNYGPAVSVQVVQDSGDPAAPTISASKVLSDQTATVVFTGADADASFLRYEACTAAVPTTSTCSASPACAFAAVPQSWPVALAANQRTCLWAQTVDKAGRTSTTVGTSIVSDSSSPTPPVFRPSYDPSAVTVRAEWVDFWLDKAPTDAAWGGDWKGVAWIEVDTGAGFQALCPDATCHANDTYNPCAAGCTCSDARRRCDGTTFAGLRIPLASESVNSIAFRAVDLAGNAGSGVSQDVATEAIADVVTANNVTEFSPSIQGNMVTWTVQNTSSQVILDLGTNRRADPTDTTCTVPSARLGVLASRTLLAYTYGGGIYLRRAAPGGALCGSDTTTLLAGPAPYSVLGASGERIAWTEGPYGSMTYKVREPGPNGTLGDADDVTVTLPGTYPSFWNLQLAGTQLLAMTLGGGMPAGSGWRVWSAPTGFGGSVTTWDLPITFGVPAALSPDGNMLAYVYAGSIVAQLPTGGRYTDADAKATMPLPPGFSAGDSIAVDGNHVVLADQQGGAFVHWTPGQDGIFGTADDLYVTIRPSKAKRDGLALSQGVLVYEENLDIFSLDLTTLRWEDVPPGYDNPGGRVAIAASSAIFGGAQQGGGGSMPVTARCPSGRDTTDGTVYTAFSANGDYIAANVWGAGLYLLTRDTGGASPSGCFFTGSSTSQLLWGPAQVPVYGGAALESEVLGETVLVANRPNGFGPTDTRVYALEPSGAATMLTSGASYTLLSSNIEYPYGLGLTSKQAVYFCGRTTGGTYQICVKGKGAGNLFRGAGAPAEQVLVHPTDAAIVADRGTTIFGQHVKVSGTRLVVDTLTSGTIVIDAGSDGLFGTADDHEITLVPYALSGPHYAIAGDWIAYVDGGAPAGDQVYLYNVLDRTARQLTSHISSKTNVAVDANGRVWWEDSVFGNTWSLWTRTP